MNNTLVKGLALLEQLARSSDPQGISELSRTLGIGKSNAHRLAQALTELGYLNKNATEGTYRASLKLWELGNALMTNLDLPRIAGPQLRGLLERSEETVYFAMLEGDDVVYLDILDSPQPVRANLQRGARRACWTTSSGKALIAWQDDAYLESLSRRLRPFTEFTFAKPDAFLKEMAKIRANGYSTSRDENRVGLSGVSAPVFGPNGTPIAAIGVSGPTDRLRPAWLKAMAPHVVAAATAIQQSMFGEPPSGGPRGAARPDADAPSAMVPARAGRQRRP